MKKKPPASADDPNERIAALVFKLQETQRELQELTGGGIDGVLYSGGQSYLLQEAQEKLRQSEISQRQLADTLMTILNALPAHIALLDARGGIISVNNAWQKFATANFLQGPDFGVDENYLEICDKVQGDGAEEAHASAQGIRQVLRGELKQFTIEYPCHSTDEKRWFQLIVTPVSDDRLAGAVVMHIDITARKLAEEALRATAGSLAISQGIAKLGSWEMDLENLDNLRANPLTWSDEMYRLLGYEPNSVDVTPDFYLQHLPGEERELIEQRLLDVIRRNDRQSFYYPVTRSDGVTRIVHTQAQALCEKSGRPLKLIGTVHDVTEAKMSEERLLANAALLEAQLNSTLDGVIVIDSAGRKVLHNQRILELWKLPPEIAEAPENEKRLEWMARQVKEPEPFLEKIAWLYAHPAETSLDQLELVDGRFLERYSAPVVDKKGSYYGRIWVTRDITERKLSERRAIEQLDLLSMAGRVGKLGAWAAEYPGPKLIWSEEVYRIHEVEPGFKLDHDSALSFFTPDSRATLEAAIESRQPYDLELEIITAKGNKRWVRTTSALEWKGGMVQRLYGVFQDCTDRKSAEKRLRRLVDSNAQSVFFWNKRGEIMDANDAFLSLMGYTHEDLKAGRMGWAAMTPPEYVERDRRAMDEVDAHGFCKTYEKDFIRKDGSRVPVMIGAATFEDNPNEGICFVIDVTRRKRVESRFRQLVASNAQGVMFWNKAGPIVDGNDAFLRLVGYTREDLQAGRLNWQDLTPPEHLAAARRVLEEIPSNGSCAPLETEWIRKDGARIPVYLSAGSFEDDPNQGVTFALDLSERKKTESRFRRLIDSNVQNVMFWSRDGQVIDANDGFLRLIGYTREDLRSGRINWRNITPPEYAELDQRCLEEVATKGVCAPFEKEYFRKDGSRVPVLIGSAAFEDNPNEGVRFVVDLTERKKLEQQFLRAQRMESIGTLAGGIAHDLNNILAPIMMSIEILKYTATDPQAKSILETIEVSSKRGADIVRQVLSFARGMEGERIEVQPKHLLKDIETIIRDTFPKSIRQELSLPDDPWTILGDPTLLHQILLNLCVNARDAMPNGGKLTLKVENSVLDEQYATMNPQAKPGRYVLISVTDTGMGIPPENIDKIFEPFFTTKEVGKGTGLGLSTVLGIVKSHEGIINVYSEPGKGTTFRVYLPASERSAEGQKKQTQPVSLPRGNGEMVLIVDDEASVLTITSQTLQAFGYRVLTATDGAEAVAVYANHQHEIAVVLTDMTMPVMDGLATIRALLRINPAVKIIAASGLNANGGVTKVAEANVKHFLTKPYTAGTLLKALRMILEKGA